MNNPDHISESIETVFRIKILKFFDADSGPGSGKEKFGSGFRDGQIRIRDKKDKQLCKQLWRLIPVLQIRTELREVAAPDQEASDLPPEASDSHTLGTPEEQEKTKTKEKIFKKTTGKLLSGTGKFQVQKPGKR
jgi:hypothetical protein